MSTWECLNCGLMNHTGQRQCQACFTMNCNIKPEDTVQLLVFGWIRLFIESQVDNIPNECKLICKDFFGGLIDSKILEMDEESALLQYVQQQTKRDWNWNLIYKGSEHGYDRDDFYRHCEDKSNTVVIVHNEDDHVFGGYTPCSWKKHASHLNGYGTDDTLSTFLFILRSKENETPQILKLKEERKHRAVCYMDNTAFDFGFNDLFLYKGEIGAPLIAPRSNFAFEGVANGDRYLSGSRNYTKPQEIEVYELL